ncbi:MAG: hypothetical protein NVS1B14_02730 [Vulcanimicrobiaceae bacterium]
MTSSGIVQPWAAEKGACMPVDFQNFVYAQHPCGSGTIVMHHGHGDYDYHHEQTFSLDFGKVYRGTVAGRPFAVVVLSCGLPVGSSSRADIYAISQSRALFVAHAGDVNAGSGGYAPDSWVKVRFAGDRLYVRTLRNPEWDPRAWTTTTYKVVKGVLRAVFTQSRVQ